jgi:hypothetical protein
MKINLASVCIPVFASQLVLLDLTRVEALEPIPAIARNKAGRNEKSSNQRG